MVLVSNIGPSTLQTHLLVHRRESTLFEKRNLVVLLMDINTRVGSVGVDDQWPGGSETVCVLVENDVTFILNELF